MTPSRLVGLAVAVGGMLALGGCISLFPKPVQLYRFDPDTSPAASAPASGLISVRESPIDFVSGGAGDKIMTVRGDEIAYIADARWDVPAERLFQGSVEQAFDTSGGPVRLVEPGQASEAQDRLALEVTRFEVDYGAAGATPEVVVSLRATLTREADLAFIGSQEFDITEPASEDRVGPIVEAFKAATGKAVQGMTSWVEQTAGKPPAAS